MLIYGICYYYGVNKIQNILNHIKCFNNIKKDDDIFCLNIMVDSFDKDVWIKIGNKFHDLLKSYEVKNFKILIDYNSGGTVLGLYNTFNCYKHNDNDKNVYIAFFEEDFYPINNDWLNDSINLLNNNGYIYIGSTNGSTPIKIDKLDKIQRETIHSNKLLNFKTVLLNHDAKLCDKLYWTDGGYYFSSISKFNRIYEKIGIFHKGDKNVKYNHGIDGVILGEVGFPSQIKKYFEFTALKQSNYFIHISK